MPSRRRLPSGRRTPPSAGEQVGARVSSTIRAGSHIETTKPGWGTPRPSLQAQTTWFEAPPGRLPPPMDSPAMRIGKRQAQQMSVMSLPEKSSASGQPASRPARCRTQAEDKQSRDEGAKALAHGPASGGTSATTKTRPRDSTNAGTRSRAKRSRRSGVSR